MSIKKGQRDYAIRRALDVFDEWLDITGIIPRFSGYYYGMCGVIENAVDIGMLVTLNMPFELNEDGEIKVIK